MKWPVNGSFVIYLFAISNGRTTGGEIFRPTSGRCLLSPVFLRAENAVPPTGSPGWWAPSAGRSGWGQTQMPNSFQLHAWLDQKVPRKQHWHTEDLILPSHHPPSPAPERKRLVFYNLLQTGSAYKLTALPASALPNSGKRSNQSKRQVVLAARVLATFLICMSTP